MSSRVQKCLGQGSILKHLHSRIIEVSVVVLLLPNGKRKKKKFSNILQKMMKESTKKDVQKEKEALRQCLGGGQFSKIDKI